MEIKIEDLYKVFPARKKTDKDTIAVNNMNLLIPSGKLVGLLGPSGCGKSTTLYLLSGLETPTKGNIYFGDLNVTKLPPEKRGIGLVFQNYALYPHMTVEQNIMFPLTNQKVDKETMKAKDVFDAARAGDPLGLFVLEMVADTLGRAISIIELAVDVDTFYIGGGVSNAGALLIDKITEYYKRYAHYAVKNITIKRAALGNDAGMLGAAYLF
jgi:ABC-type sulfate/molybdate transport systems ATPase subunit